MNMDAFLIINTIYLIPAIILSTTIFFIFKFRFKIKIWYLSDIFIVLSPGNLYFILDRIRLERFLGSSKSLGNIITELISIGIGCGLIFLLRAILGKKFPNNSRKFSLLGILLMVILTVCVYIFTPSLPE